MGYFCIIKSSHVIRLFHKAFAKINFCKHSNIGSVSWIPIDDCLYFILCGTAKKKKLKSMIYVFDEIVE
jgi:hypothetical protein